MFVPLDLLVSVCVVGNMMKNCIRPPILGFSDKFENLILVIRFSPQFYNHFMNM